MKTSQFPHLKKIFMQPAGTFHIVYRNIPETSGIWQIHPGKEGNIPKFVLICDHQVFLGSMFIWLQTTDPLVR